jgi:hypothetical protein
MGEVVMAGPHFMGSPDFRWQDSGIMEIIHLLAVEELSENSSYVMNSIRRFDDGRLDTALSMFVSNNSDEVGVKTYWILVPFMLKELILRLDPDEQLDVLEGMSYAGAINGKDEVTSSKRTFIVDRYDSELKLEMLKQLDCVSGLFDNRENRSADALFTVCAIYRNLGACI